MKTCYLAGPIIGHTEDDANGWRDDVIHLLSPHNIRGISPLRCEPPCGERYTSQYPDQRFGTARAISSKNVFDVRTCDMLLAYAPLKFTQVKPIYGTLCELAWAHLLGKPTVLVTDDPYIREHPLINACAGWMLETVEQGVEVILGVLQDYAHPRSYYAPMRTETACKVAG